MNLHNPTNLKLQCRVWCKSQTWYFCPNSFTSYLISQQRRAEVIFTGGVFASPLARYLTPALPPGILPSRIQERHLPLRPECQAGLEVCVFCPYTCHHHLHLSSPKPPITPRPLHPSNLHTWHRCCLYSYIPVHLTHTHLPSQLHPFLPTLLTCHLCQSHATPHTHS